jgi:hypothetical protein
MNPVTRVFRRSRAFRVAFYILMAPVWALVAFISINSFGAYSEVGEITLLLLIMLFAAWAWWYDEDRDRRRAAKANRADDDHRPPASG